MDWLNIILEHVSKYSLENITTLEREYLTKFDTHHREDIENELTIRRDFYYELSEYELTHNFLSDIKWTDAEIKYSRLNMIWDNMETDDVNTISKIYDIPKLFMNLTWANLPTKYKKSFENYLRTYYMLHL